VLRSSHSNWFLFFRRYAAKYSIGFGGLKQHTRCRGVQIILMCITTAVTSRLEVPAVTMWQYWYGMD